MAFLPGRFPSPLVPQLGHKEGAARAIGGRGRGTLWPFRGESALLFFSFFPDFPE